MQELSYFINKELPLTYIIYILCFVIVFLIFHYREIIKRMKSEESERKGKEIYETWLQDKNNNED